MPIQRRLLLDNPTDPSEQRPSLDGFELFDAESDKSMPISFLPALNEINVLVGPNNSGKSRLLRQLFSQDWLEVDQESANRLVKLFDWHSEAVKETQGWVDNPADTITHHYLSLIAAVGKFIQSPVEVTKVFPPEGTGFVLSNDLELFLSPYVTGSMRRGDAGIQYFLKFLEVIGLGLEQFQTKQGQQPGVESACFARITLRNLSPGQWRVYCPPIRSTQRIADSFKSDYILAAGLLDINFDPLALSFAHSYGWDIASYSSMVLSNSQIATGQRLYEQVDSVRKSDQQTRNRWKEKTRVILGELLGLKGDLELIASNHRNHSENTLTPIQHLRVALHRDYSLHELGDGISACLIMLMPLLVANAGPGMLCIEEPETHLHPGLQRKLIELLCRDDIRGEKRLCLTTHSPTILDAIRDVAGAKTTIIRVDRIEQDESVRHRVQFLSDTSVDTLEALGASANALLARSLILVEGPSDVRYVRALIEMFGKGKDLVEARDFVIMTYGGSLLEDLISQGNDKLEHTLPSIGHYCLVIADEDIGKSEKHQQIRKWFQNTHGRFEYQTTEKATEIENLFPAPIWERIFPKIGPKKWSQPAPGKAFPSSEEMLQIRLGSIADYVYGSELSELPAAKDSKTLASDKTAAARLFVEMVKAGEITQEQVGEAAREFTHRIIGFIEKAKERSQGTSSK